MSDSHAESPQQQQDAENDIAGEQKTPARTPSKRKSKLEREREESEEIIKSMGGAVEEGGRRTRSSARGSVASTPVTPAAKKPRVSRGRGKPKKIDVDDEVNDAEEGAQKPENEDKQEIKESADSMEVDENTDAVQSNDIVEKTHNDDENKSESPVEQPKENDSEAVPVVDNSLTEERAKSPVKNDIAPPNEDVKETPKVEVPPSPAKDSPVTRPIEEAAIPDASKEATEVNEKANEYSHTNNEVDSVIKDTKTDEIKIDAPSNAEPTIKPTESSQEVAAAL